MPAPRVLDSCDGWLLLSGLPGLPLHEALWKDRPGEIAEVIVDALRRLGDAGVTHGDMCLPNILGDPESGKLSGIVDWRYAGRYGREIDVASAVWSCGFNGYGNAIAVTVLGGVGWPKCDADEVERLSAVWMSTCPPHEPEILTPRMPGVRIYSQPKMSVEGSRR